MHSAKKKPAGDVVHEMLEQWRGERPDLDLTGMAVVLRVLILAQDLGRRLKETLQPFELQPWEFDVLSALRRVGEPFELTPTELCSSAHLTSGAMTNRIDRLEERSLVRREADEADGRSWLVVLTRKGRLLVDRAIGARVQDAAESVSALKASERRALADLLASVLDEAGS